MRRLTPVCAVLLALVAYGASPYVTLYRLDRALRSGDVDTINAHVDWTSLRQGVVAQIDQAITGQADPKPDYSELPAFGAGFVHHMTTHMVDKAMQRDAMMAQIRQYAFSRAPITEAADGPARLAEASREAPPRALRWACFDGPTSFHAVLRIGQADAAQDVDVEFRLVGGTWTVVHATMPATLLMQAASRT